ncbi:MAG: FtsW/RodA/SpoVE family cell cycle protein [Bacteroidales bacterium]|nr:FtsW/RodA/SpoVE family cell cycle protein [Bacteroidales bacterium]
MDFLKRYFKGDLVVWMVYFLLVLISIICMYSASYRLTQHSSTFGPILKHIIMLGAGFIVMYVTQFATRQITRISGWALLFISWVLLIATLVFGQSGGDAHRSLQLGGISIQPSEFARLAILIVIADIIHRFHEHRENEKGYYYTILGLFAVTVILIITQALSTSLLLCLTLVATIIYAGFSWKLLLKSGAVVGALIAILSLSCVASYNAGHYNNDYISQTNAIHAGFLKATKRSETWIARFKNFGAQSDEENKYIITDKNIQESNAAIAIALGRHPAGPGNSQQRRVLPNADNDFIFAIIVEEFGVFGAVVIMMLYIFLLYRCFRIANQSTNTFDSTMVMSLSLIILLQALLHIAISVGFVPVTGQSLPLIGRGGSSIVIISAYIGLSLSVAERNNRRLNNEQDQTEEEQSTPSLSSNTELVNQ